MASVTAFPGRLDTPLATRDRRRPPPSPLRTRSECEPLGGLFGLGHGGGHARHNSTSTTSTSLNTSSRFKRTQIRGLPSEQEVEEESSDQDGDASPDQPCSVQQPASGVLTPPLTPDKSRSRTASSESENSPELLAFDSSRIDYELEGATVLGSGLWSVVVLADAVFKPACPADPNLPSPPTSPQKKRPTPSSSLFAIKKPARRDAIPVFHQEAKILTYLMRQRATSQYIIPFYGLDERNSALVFEAVIGGSLEALNNRLKQMTEVSRHLELITIFLTLALDLISGLDFMHAAGVVHADLKPANVLLDISEHPSLPRPVIRARYIDFSAAFRPAADDGASAANAGGTWDYMAPEQMRIQKDLSTPTAASDVWSLGITLLSLIVGGSPYTAACGGNVFMLREAVKSGDPLGFARMDPVAHKRMAACQDYVDCCRLALHKDRDRRTSAKNWKAWVGRQFGSN